MKKHLFMLFLCLNTAVTFHKTSNMGVSLGVYKGSSLHFGSNVCFTGVSARISSVIVPKIFYSARIQVNYGESVNFNLPSSYKDTLVYLNTPRGLLPAVIIDVKNRVKTVNRNIAVSIIRMIRSKNHKQYYMDVNAGISVKGVLLQITGKGISSYTTVPVSEVFEIKKMQKKSSIVGLVISACFVKKYAASLETLLFLGSTVKGSGYNSFSVWMSPSVQHSVFVRTKEKFSPVASIELMLNLQFSSKFQFVFFSEFVYSNSREVFHPEGLKGFVHASIISFPLTHFLNLEHSVHSYIDIIFGILLRYESI